jgi:hypothetical protein
MVPVHAYGSHKGFEVFVVKSWWITPCVLLGTATVSAHVNDMGMDYRRYKDRYGQSCCHDRDCRPAADFVETVVSGRPVVRLLINGIWISVPRSYIVGDYSSDGRAHFCGHLHVPGNDPSDVRPEPVCVILPLRNS